MYGMVTALIIQNATAATQLRAAGAPAYACVIQAKALIGTPHRRP